MSDRHGPADATSAAVPARKQHRGRRFLIELVAVLVGLALLAWAADSLARRGAESLLARNIQNATGVADLPQVEVTGLLFLPQVIRGAYQEVQVTTRGVTSGPLRVEEVRSQLFDVRVPFRDVLLRNVRRVGIARSVEDATLTYADLNAYLDATGRPMQLGPSADGGVTLTGGVDILGRTVQASADVTLAVAAGQLRLTPRQIKTGDAGLNRASRLLLGQRLTLTVPLGTLPFGHELQSVTPYQDGLIIEAEGRGIILRP